MMIPLYFVIRSHMQPLYRKRDKMGVKDRILQCYID